MSGSGSLPFADNAADGLACLLRILHLRMNCECLGYPPRSPKARDRGHPHPQWWPEMGTGSRPAAAMCKNGSILSNLLLCVFPTDKGDKAGVDPYNRILAR